jgi:hypothetical protein|tara:strand:+ start:1474 stop:2046 length:573 start_codon:yes stop_codon:yes gene_type:complete
MAAVDFKVIKSFFTPDELKVYQAYCYNRVDENKYSYEELMYHNHKNGKPTRESANIGPCWYMDSLMNSLLDVKKPIVEKACGFKLYPTYSYWRYYVFGGRLKKHIDRPSCEISISACIKKEGKWPLVIDGHSIELEEGEALLYAGCDHYHWRPSFYKGEGMAQVFFHYVNQNGPNKDHAYDQIHKRNFRG